MLAVAPDALIGSEFPRIGPPKPLISDTVGYRRVAATLGIVPMPWQDTAVSYLTATDPDGLWSFREVAVVVARQNGKTTLTMPIVLQRLLAGRRIMHIAQVRELPRIMFESLADAIEESASDLLPRRRGKVIWPRRGAGSESIVLTNGGEYRIASALAGGRGFSFDDLLIDELREMESFDMINSAKPAQRFSTNPQTVYLSNAGTDKSVILNSLRTRAGEDESLAYLEWSADPDARDDDHRAWAHANPSIGHFPQVLRDLQQDYTAAKLGGNLAGFETESLCRWVPTMRPRLVDDFAWMRCRTGKLDPVTRPSVGISMDTSGRASIVMAWRQADKSIALRELFDVAVDETGVRQLGEDALKATRRYGSVTVGYDDLTDRDLARHWKKKAKSIIGKDFVNATDAFVRAVERGDVHWSEAAHITEDLTMTSRKDNTESGTFHAVKSKESVPITASLAAIRAFWLASASIPSGPLRVY